MTRNSPRVIEPWLIEKARSVDILSLAKRLGANLKPARARQWTWQGPCPGCGGNDRFALNPELRVFSCRGLDGGGDTIDLVCHVLGLGFIDAVEYLTGVECATGSSREVSNKAVKSPVSDDAIRERDLKSAMRIASEIVPIKGTPSERYLREKRGINTAALEDVLSRSDAVSWHGAVYFNEPGHALHGQRLGAIIGIMSDPVSAKPTGAISRTYIGPGLAKVCKAKTLGSPVGIVRLTPDDEVHEGLFLAEGVETALAAMSIGLRPIWSTGSKNLIAKFPLLSGIEALNLVVDHDPNGAGERAAREAEARWRAAGREVNLLRSDAPGDLNDALSGAA